MPSTPYFLLLLFSLGSIASAFTQNTESFSISGTLNSGLTGKPVSGASVSIGKGIGTSTDTAGRFSINGLKTGTYRLHFSCLDYQHKDTIVTIEGENLQNLTALLSTNCRSVNEKKADNDFRKGEAVLFINTRTRLSDTVANQQFKKRYGVSFTFNDLNFYTEDCA